MRRLARSLLWLVGGLLLAVLLLQWAPVKSAVVRSVLTRVNPYPDTEVTVETVGGSILGSLELTGLRITRPDGSVPVAVDSLRAAYRLLPALRGRIRIENVAIAGAGIDMIRDSSGVDLARPFESERPDSTTLDLRLNRLSVRSSRVSVADSLGLWEVRDLRVLVRDLITAPVLAVVLDTLAGAIRDPFGAGPGRLSASGVLGAASGRLDSLVFVTARSDLRASGAWTGTGLLTDSVGVDIVAAPLHFDDVRPLFGGLREGGMASLSIRAGSVGAPRDGVGDEVPEDRRATIAITGDMGGGDIRADLTAVLPADSLGRTGLRGSASVAGIDLSKILASIDGPTPLDADLSTDLSGPDWQRLSGSSTFNAAAFEFGDITLANFRSSQNWTDGSFASTLSGRVNGGRTVGTVGLSPFRTEIPVDAALTLSGWQLQRWVDGDLEGTVNGTVRVRGELGTDRWTAEALLSGTQLGDCRIEGPVSVRQVPGAISGNIRLEACNGRFEGSGRFRPATQAWQIDRLAISDLDWASALEDTSASRLSALVIGSGTGARYEAQITAGAITYADYRIDSLAAQITGERTSWQAVGEVFTGPGSIGFSGGGLGGAGVLDRLDLEDLDLAYTAGLIAFPSSLSARAEGRIGPDLTNIEVRIDSSRVGDQSVGGGRVSLIALGDSVSSTGSLDLLPRGLVEWSATANLDQSSATVDSLLFRHLDVSRILKAQPPTDLSGTVRGTLRDGGGEGSLALEAVGSYNGVPIEGGTSRLSVSSDSIRIDADLGLGRGFARVSGGLSRSTYQFGGTAEVERIDLARLANYDSTGSSLTGRLTFDGNLTPAGDALDRVSATLDSLRAGYGGVRVDSASGGVDWSGGRLAFREIRVWGDPLSAQLSGTIPTDDSAADVAYRLDGRITSENLRPIAALFDQPVSTAGTRLTIQGRGRPGAFRLSLQGDVQGLRFGDLNIATSELLASAELGHGLTPVASEVRYSARQLSLPGMTAQRGSAGLTLRNDSLTVESELYVDEGRRLSMRANVDSSLSRVTVTGLEADLDDAAWDILAPVDIDLTDGVQISGLVAEADSQRIALGGQAFGDTPDNMYLAAANVRLDALAEILGFQGFGATLNSSLSLTSQGSAETRSINGTVSGGIRHLGREAAAVDGRVSVRDDRLNIDASVIHVDGSEAVIRGFIPMSITGADISDDPVGLRLDADAFPINWTLPFFDPLLVDQLEGELGAEVTVRGTYGDPTLGGSARLTDGRMGLPLLGKPGDSLVYDRIDVRVSLSEDAIRVDSASVHSGPGTATATGVIELPDLSLGEIDLDILARDFLAIDSSPYRAIVGGDLNLKGTTLSPVLGGRVEVARGDFYLTDETTAAAFEPVTLSTQDLFTLEQRFGLRVAASDTTSFDFYEALEIEDLRINLARNTWVRSSSNPKMDIQFTGSLDVSKKPLSELSAFGVIEVIPDRSRIDQFGRRFEIEQGTLTFNGAVDEPDMNLRAVYNVRSRRSQANEVTIRLQADGSPQDLEVTFSSDPAMDLADIISYIATGRPASQSLQFGGTATEGYLQSAAGLAVGPITSLVENIAGSGLGLDVVEIEQDESSGLMLTAGKYVSPRFFVSVSQPIDLSSSSQSSSGNSTEVTMEYEILRSLLVSLLSSGTVLRVNLRWETAY